MKTKDSGSATIQFAVHDMDIANPVGALMVQGLTQVVSKALPASIVGLVTGEKGLNTAGSSTSEAEIFKGDMNGVITLAEGRTKQDVTLELVDPAQAKGTGGAAPAAAPKMPLHFQGDIRLADFKQDLDVSFPTQLLAKYIGDKNIAKTLLDIFPEGIPLSLKGSTLKPQVDYGDIVSRMTKGFAQAQIGNLLGGKGGNKDPLGGILGGKSGIKEDNPLGGLLDAVTGNKNAKKTDAPAEEKMDEKTPADDASPRRARGPRYRTTTPTSQPAPTK
jgi:hypothetical protein